MDYLTNKTYDSGYSTNNNYVSNTSDTATIKYNKGRGCGKGCYNCTNCKGL